LDERSSNTDGANEKAYERGKVGGVRDKPCDCVLGLRRQPENRGKEAGCARAEGMLELSVECENVLVGELESGKGSCSRSDRVRPLFAYLVDRLLNLAESVPFDECIDQCNNNDESDEDEC